MKIRVKLYRSFWIWVGVLSTSVSIGGWPLSDVKLSRIMWSRVGPASVHTSIQSTCKLTSVINWWLLIQYRSKPFTPVSTTHWCVLEREERIQLVYFWGLTNNQSSSSCRTCPKLHSLNSRLNLLRVSSQYLCNSWLTHKLLLHYEVSSCRWKSKLMLLMKFTQFLTWLLSLLF